MKQIKLCELLGLVNETLVCFLPNVNQTTAVLCVRIYMICM